MVGTNDLIIERLNTTVALLLDDQHEDGRWLLVQENDNARVTFEVVEVKGGEPISSAKVDLDARSRRLLRTMLEDA